MTRSHDFTAIARLTAVLTLCAVLSAAENKVSPADVYAPGLLPE